jgi:hypothetical protein
VARLGGGPGPLRPALATLAALLVAALSAGCVSMPTGGPVQSYPVTQGTGAPNQPNVQFQPQPPGDGWNPSQIVEGFLAASAAFGANGQVVQQYLTTDEWNSWKNSWSALVYKSGPDVTAATYPPGVKKPTTATVKVTGKIQANLQGSGSYSVPSASSQDGADAPDAFQLQKVGSQWRISYAPPELLLTSSSFQNDYQLRNLYFFDPLSKYLVPDPVYVPVAATQGDLMHGLVQDLITPPADWLSGGATATAFPKGTKIADVTLNGVTAVVNLTGTITRANSMVLLRVSAQLWSTLSSQSGSSGQPVQSIELLLNGRPWAPPGKNSAVQPSAQYHPPQGSSSEFYYVDSAGYLVGRTASNDQSGRLSKIGTGFSQIAVSPDGDYVAALRGHTLYGGVATGPLFERGTGYVSLSWDVNDNLWASTGGRIVMFRASAGTQQPLGPMVPVTVNTRSQNPVEPPFTSLKVAPDGVRVAIVEADGTSLTFGAISGQQGPNPQIMLSTVLDTLPASAPDNATFTGLSWYGSDNVITLATPDPVVTEYPVSGGGSTSIPTDPDMQTITASAGQPLITSLPHGLMASDASLSGSWMSIGNNDVPISGSIPTYPG